MNTENTLSRVHLIRSIDSLPEAARLALDQLAADLTEQLQLEAAASKGRRNPAACIRRMLQSVGDERPALSGSWTDAQGRQCVCDGFRAYRLTDPLPLPTIPEDCTPLNLAAIVDPLQKSCRVSLDVPTPAALRAFIAADRAENGHKHVPVWDFGRDLPDVDARYLLDLPTVLPDAHLFADPDSSVSPLYAVSDIGDGCLLPVRNTAKMARDRLRAEARALIASGAPISPEQLACIASVLSAVLPTT